MDPVRDTELASLLARGQRGDKAAYEQFLRGASPVLRAFLLRRMPAADVEDVLQDTLIAIHDARATYEPSRPVGPWLYAICSHRMSDFYRRARRLERIVQRAGTGECAVQAPNGVSDRIAGVLEAMVMLPARQRRVVELLKLADLSVKEVARRTGMKESTVKVTAFRGYKTIRRFLGVTSK